MRKKFSITILFEGDIFICTKVDEEEPTSFVEALSSSTVEWIVVMQFEMSSIETRYESQLIFHLCVRLLEISVFSKSNAR